MKGSNVANIKFDSSKQKIVRCQSCDGPMVVGKFAKTVQTCDICKGALKGKAAADAKKVVKLVDKKKNKDISPQGTFAARLTEVAKSLDFEIRKDRIWAKKYSVADGAIMNLFIMVEPGIANAEPKVEYFSTITQRAIGLDEDFRRFMPPDAVNDCGVIASEFSSIARVDHNIGQTQCDKCGVYTDEFGVNNGTGKVYCIKPNNCFKNSYTSSGAESSV